MTLFANFQYGAYKPKDLDLETLVEIQEKYQKQMVENHLIKIEENINLLLKKKPKFMPTFLYKMVIKNLIEIQHYK